MGVLLVGAQLAAVLPGLGLVVAGQAQLRTAPGTLEAGPVEDPPPDVQPLQDEDGLAAHSAGIRVSADHRGLPLASLR